MKLVFFLHNGWGEGWGDRGYAWINEVTLQANLQAASLVDAEPWNPSSSNVPPRQERPAQCADGLLACGHRAEYSRRRFRHRYSLSLCPSGLLLCCALWGLRMFPAVVLDVVSVVAVSVEYGGARESLYRVRRLYERFTSR